MFTLYKNVIGRTLISLLLLFVVSCSYNPHKITTSAIEHGQIQQKPNILFILTDDQTANTINALGNSAIKTPNIDRLAKQGTSFSHVFNQGSWSPAVCAPSRRMINTGRHLHHTGLGPKFAKNDHAEHPLWGETLRKAGYETFMTGKWHLPQSALTRSFSLANTVHEGGMSRLKDGGQWQPWIADYDGTDNPQNFVKRKENTHTSELIATAAIDYLNNKSARNDKPFFMYVAFLAPHDPRQSPQEYVDMYPSDSIELPENFKPEHPFDQGDHKIRDEKLLPFPRTESDVKAFIAEYYAMITHLDAQIGRIIDNLEKSAYSDNTIVVFTSDHGLSVGQHGLLGKQNQYEASVRAPFIITGPNVPKNKTAKGMFYIHSVFPTTLDMAGIDIPASVQAPSILPLIQGKTDFMHKTIMGSYRYFQRMVRDQRYKLIDYPVLQKSQLFDLETDPMEMNNLINHPSQAKRIASLRLSLKEWQNINGDPLDYSNPKASYAEYDNKRKH